MASEAFPEGIPDFLRIYFFEAICEVLAPIISLKKAPKKKETVHGTYISDVFTPPVLSLHHSHRSFLSPYFLQPCIAANNVNIWLVYHSKKPDKNSSSSTFRKQFMDFSSLTYEITLTFDIFPNFPFPQPGFSKNKSFLAR